MRPQLYSSGFLVFRRTPMDAGQKEGDAKQSSHKQSSHLEFLLMQHSQRWDLPKGHLDFGESQQEAALRELKEESGIDKDSIEIDPNFAFKSQYWVNYDGVPRLKQLTIFLAMLIHDVEILITEHQGFHWFPFSPPHSIQPETIDPLLAEASSYLEGHVWLM